MALAMLAGCGQKGGLLLPGAASAAPMSPGGVPAPPLPATLSPAPLPPVRS